MTSLVLRPALACSVMAIAACDVRAQGPGAANAAAIDHYVDAFASRGHFSGTVLVAKGHDVVFEKSYGKPDYSVATQVPLIEATILSAARRAQLEGTYSYAGSRHLLTFVSSTAALIGGEYLLITTSDTTMYAPQNYLQYDVVADESGNITALSPAGGGPFTITRVR